MDLTMNVAKALALEQVTYTFNFYQLWIYDNVLYRLEPA